MLNEQSNILTTTEQPTTSNADPPDRGLPLPHPGKATPNEQLHKVETLGAVSQQTTLTSWREFEVKESQIKVASFYRAQVQILAQFVNQIGVQSSKLVEMLS